MPAAGTTAAGWRRSKVWSITTPWRSTSRFSSRPPTPDTGKPSPYAADDLLSTAFGTGDKLFIDGHYYSDKSPVPALGMGLVYCIVQQTTGLVARDRVDVFCRMLTILYFRPGLCGCRGGHVLTLSGIGLQLGMVWAATASFGLSTMALTYAEHVNNHSLFLGVAALLMLELCAGAAKAATANPISSACAGSAAWPGGLRDRSGSGSGPDRCNRIAGALSRRARSWGSTALVAGMTASAGSASCRQFRGRRHAGASQRQRGLFQLAGL